MVEITQFHAPADFKRRGGERAQLRRDGEDAIKFAIFQRSGDLSRDSSVDPKHGETTAIGPLSIHKIYVYLVFPSCTTHDP